MWNKGGWQIQCAVGGGQTEERRYRAIIAMTTRQCASSVMRWRRPPGR